MEERRLQLLVGLMVLATIVVLSILLGMFAGQEPLLRRTKEILIHFPEAPGISPNTPVRKSGVLIGRVTRVQLAEEIPEYADWGGVIVTIELDYHRKIFTDEECLMRRTLLGDAVLEFVRRRSPRVPPAGATGGSTGANQSEELQPQSAPQANGQSQASNLAPRSHTVSPAVFLVSNGATAVVQREEIPPGGPPLRGRVLADPMEVVANLQADLAEGARGVRNASDQIAQFVSRLNELVANEDGLQAARERIRELASESSETLRALRTLVENLNALAGDPEFRAQIQQAGRDLPAVLADARQTLSKTQEAFDQLKIASTTAQENLTNLRQFTQALGQRGPAIAERLEETLGGLATLSKELSAFSQQLGRDDTTLGKLTTDSELYDNVNQLVLQVDALTQQLQPVLRDLRVFSDRIARNPESLGVRGALERSPGTKGVPSLSELDPMGWRQRTAADWSPVR